MDPGTRGRDTRRPQGGRRTLGTGRDVARAPARGARRRIFRRVTTPRRTTSCARSGASRSTRPGSSSSPDGARHELRLHGPHGAGHRGRARLRSGDRRGVRHTRRGGLRLRRRRGGAAGDGGDPRRPGARDRRGRHGPDGGPSMGAARRRQDRPRRRSGEQRGRRARSGRTPAGGGRRRGVAVDRRCQSDRVVLDVTGGGAVDEGGRLRSDHQHLERRRPRR